MANFGSYINSLSVHIFDLIQSPSPTHAHSVTLSELFTTEKRPKCPQRRGIKRFFFKTRFQIHVYGLIMIGAFLHARILAVWLQGQVVICVKGPSARCGLCLRALCIFMADCENLKSDDFNSYGTFLGLRYCKGTGAIRLMYCTIVALALSLFRIIADLALGFAIVHHSSWSFLIASLVDLLLAVTASAAAWFAVKERRYGIIAAW